MVRGRSAGHGVEEIAVTKTSDQHAIKLSMTCTKHKVDIIVMKAERWIHDARRTE
jgi:hypothetical protein